MLTNCLMCSAQYEEEDNAPYYCEPCLSERKKIAAEIDKKRLARPPKPVKSDLQIFDEISKARGSKFLNIKDLGIRLHD